MNESKPFVCMVEDIPDDAPQEAKDMCAALQKEKVSFSAGQNKGLRISPYVNLTQYGGKYQH